MKPRKFPIAERLKELQAKKAHARLIFICYPDFIECDLPQFYGGSMSGTSCPNCHAMIHRRNPPLSVDELRSLM